MDVRINKSRDISLLPYLSTCKDSPPVGLSLTFIDPISKDRSAGFNILQDSDPIIRLMDARFVTDSGSVLKSVFLLLQKDRYGLVNNELWPLTNIDIDDAWHNAIGVHANCSRTILSAQMGEKGQINSFSSLFYCKKTDIFFSPPCPQCGNTLELCKDDVRLLSSGLQTYSGSTKRYLYCVPCSSQHTNIFFARDLENCDPENVHDLHALIASFGSLREKTDLNGGFPCITCPDHNKCYIKSRDAHTKIVPFSFYPFYLLIFDSLSLPAIDFLPLISGASMAELINKLSANSENARKVRLESIQKDCIADVSLFPAHDERYFLEVLFLKLSFLCNVFQQAFSQQRITGEPEMRLTIDRIWVGLPGQVGLLPTYWNFKTRILDIVRPPDMAQMFQLNASSNLFHAAILWFYSLLANSRQDSRDLIPYLKETLSGDGNLSEILSDISANPVFSPEQIFWEPDGKRVSRRWMHLWNHALRLGFKLMQSAIHPDRQWFFIAFNKELESFCAEVRGALFNGLIIPENLAERGEQADDDQIINKALTNIIGKWRLQETTKMPAEERKEDPGLMETIILQSNAMSPPAQVRDTEEYTETVILSSSIVTPQGRVGKSNQAENDTHVGTSDVFKNDSANLDTLPETIIMSSQRPIARSKAWKE